MTYKALYHLSPLISPTTSWTTSSSSVVCSSSCFQCFSVSSFPTHLHKLLQCSFPPISEVLFPSFFRSWLKCHIPRGASPGNPFQGRFLLSPTLVSLPLSHLLASYIYDKLQLYYWCPHLIYFYLSCKKVSFRKERAYHIPRYFLWSFHLTINDTKH